MAKARLVELALWAGTLGLVACSTPQQASDAGSTGSDGDPVSWNQSMQELSQTLSALIPELTAPEFSKSDEARQRMLRLSEKLGKNAHQVDGAKVKPSEDPALRFVAQGLKSDVDEAVRKMKAGHWEKGQRQMLSVSRHCIDCHTMKLGPLQNELPSLSPDLSRFSLIQRGDFFAAIKKFDLAIENYEKALVDKAWAKENEAEWNQAFQKLLAISIRVTGNPSLTMELISRFIDSGSYPVSLQESARVWRTHAKEWRQESEVSTNRREMASQLLNRGRKLGIKEGPNQGLILFLRASALMHSHMASDRAGRDPESLYLAGQIAESLASLNFGSFPEDYYRACIQTKGVGASWRGLCKKRLVEMGLAKR